MAVTENDSIRISDSDILGAPILIVDDHPPNLTLIDAFLSAAGFTNLSFAQDGLQALEAIEAKPPTLLVLDIMMPRMDGFEVCRRIREGLGPRDLPILVQTALESGDDRSKAFEVGATDLVTKPIHGRELVSRVRIHVERRMLMDRLVEFHHRLADELEAARLMHNALMPTNEDIAVAEKGAGVRVSAVLRPSTELGGDLWTIVPAGDGKLGLFLGDLTGHGLVAAVNAFRLHALLHDETLNPSEPTGFFFHLNNRLAELLPDGHFAAAWYGVLDPSTERLRYVAAAWPTSLILETNGRDIRELSGRGLPLGIVENAEWEVQEVPFTAGAGLLCYSDALIESPGEDGQTLTTEELGGWFASDPGGIVGILQQQLRSRGVLEIPDDLTIVRVMTGAADN